MTRSRKAHMFSCAERWKSVTLLAFVLSLFVFLISVLLLCFLDSLIEMNVRKMSVLEEGTLILKQWSDPHYFIRTNMFTFSVTNPDEVTQGERPVLKRVGPYAFDQVQRRIVRSIGNGTVKYETVQHYHFNETGSCPECLLYNRVWIPNLVYQKFVEAASKPQMKPAVAALAVQTPFLEVEVAELLFDGYADPFLDQVCSLPVVNFVCEQILDLPDRIGLFYKKNGSSSGVYEVEDGRKEGGESLGRILSWNNATKLPDYWWESAQATAINGSDGTLMPPYISKEERITIFVAEMCRSIDLVFQKEVEYEGIPLYRFIMPSDSWDWTLPRNRGFCHSDSGKVFFEGQSAQCLPPGMLDVSRCQKGEPPIVVSMPNFLYASDIVQKSIEGLKMPPVQELDQIEVDVEPRLGTVVQAHRRFLINISMWKGANLTMPELEKFRSSIVPVLEIDEYIHIDDDNLELIKSKLLLVESAVTIGSICGLVVSVAALLLAIAYFIFMTRRNSNACSGIKYGNGHRPNGVSPIPANGTAQSKF